LMRLDREAPGAKPEHDLLGIGPRIEHAFARRIDDAGEDDLAIERPVRPGRAYACGAVGHCDVSFFLRARWASSRSSRPSHAAMCWRSQSSAPCSALGLSEHVRTRPDFS